MDQASQVGGILGIVLTVVGMVYGAINHKRLRSTCCGRKIDISVDIDSTSPLPLHDRKIRPITNEDNQGTIVEIKPIVTPENGKSTYTNRI